jgi:hypothetical protein
MFRFLKSTLNSTTATYRHLSNRSTYVFNLYSISITNTTYSVPSDGISIRVGDSYARVVHIPQSILNAQPQLNRHLSNGATIVNTDPIVFEIALEYLSQNNFFSKMRPLARCPLEELIGGSDMMLKLAKAWHLAAMLHLPQMQNKLIDVFSACYRQFVEARIRVPLCREPFNYLRDHMGHYSKCEKFMVEFYAGLARHTGEFRSGELKHLPDDIARVLQQRRGVLAVRGIQSDRVARGNSCFKVHKNDTTQPVTLHIRPSLSLSTTSSAASPQSRSRISRSISSLTTFLSTTTPGSTMSGRGHHARHSLPLLASMSGNPERAVQRALEPALWSTVGHAPTRPPLQPRSISMPMLLSRAPFDHPSAMHERPRSAIAIAMEEDSSSDDDDYDMFAPDNLFIRKKPRHVGVNANRRRI